MSYQKRDYEVVDYQLFKLPRIGLLRGPAPATLGPGDYFTCVGAAQTFGCFCAKPYPSLLAERLGLPALNFGLAGAGPRLFIESEDHLRYINQARFAVIQIMSGRSEDNSVFKTGGRAVLAKQPDRYPIEQPSVGPPARDERPYVRAEEAWGELLANENPKLVREIVAETRANWVQTFSRLLEAIEVPKIVLWFSKRAPDYEEGYSDVFALFGEFPQLVNRAMVEQISAGSEYVECVTSRGMPQRLVSRFTGEPVSINDQVWSDDQGALQTIEQAANTYYPSPEMHEDAADALMEACRTYAPGPTPLS